MKLEVGMYARIDGRIGKIIEICTCEQCEARGYYEPTIEYAHGETEHISVYWKDNLKASHNIIDLIEVGDYVNGHKVLGVYNFRVEVESDAIENETWEEIESYEIKSIVTKEQFESMSYKL